MVLKKSFLQLHKRRPGGSVAKSNMSLRSSRQASMFRSVMYPEPFPTKTLQVAKSFILLRCESRPSLVHEAHEQWNCDLTGGSPTGPDPENRVGDQDIGSPGRPVSSGLQVPGETGHCRARKRPPWWPSRGVGVFPSKCPSIAPAEMSNTPRW